MNENITLPNGQVISASDPNYAAYKSQQPTPATPSTPSMPAPAAMTLNQAKESAEKAFSGLVAPMTLEQIRAREAEAKAGVQQTASAVYDPTISREKQAGASQVSTAEGVVGQRQGFNISTAEQAFVADVQNKVLDRVREVENIKANYISQGNLAAADRADQQLQQLNEWNTQMTIAKAEYALKVMSGNREQAQLELQKASQATQAAQAAAQLELANEELKLNAYQTALKTPVGQTFEVNGIEYIGMANLEGIDPSLISLSTDDKGYETGINKLTGEILWKSKVPTGKTKTAAASVTVNMAGEQRAGLQDAVGYLATTRGSDGYYNSGAVASELQKYAIQNPGKASQFWDVVKPYINPKDLPSLQAQQSALTAEDKIEALFN